MPAAKGKQRRTQRERTEATTSRLLEAARSLFARDGYAATSLDAVVAKCGVTKGAFYHHFSGKEELFRAVFEAEVERGFAAVSQAGARKRDAVSAGYEGFKAYLDFSLEPGVQRITLIDAPGVLGWEVMRAVDARYSLRLVKETLRHGMGSGQIARRDVDALAHILFGAMLEAALFVARAEDQQSARRKVLRKIRMIFESLRA